MDSNTQTTRLIGAIAAAALTLAACGASSDQGGSDTQLPVTAAAPDSAAPDTQSPSTEPPAATDPPSTDAPTTTAAPEPEPEPFDLADLPDLVATADAATRDPAIDPFSVVDDIIGFPLPIPVPDGSTLLQFDVDMSVVVDEGSAGWNARYDVVAPGGAVDDIDLEADDNGPGSQQVIDIFDPIMTDLGFERKNSTASDPGDQGGPSSVNHVYVATDPAAEVNGTPAVLDPVFIWSTEDINGWAYDEQRAELGGYTVDVGFETTKGESTPFPLADAVLDGIPLPDGIDLTDVAIRLRNRSADAYEIDKGATYIEIVFDWEAAPDAYDQLAAFYADPTTVFTDEAVFMAGEADFFDEGTIARTEPYIYDSTDLRLDILLLQQFGGLFGIDESDDGVEPVTLRLSVELNPNDVPLTFPAD